MTLHSAHSKKQKRNLTLLFFLMFVLFTEARSSAFWRLRPLRPLSAEGRPRSAASVRSTFYYRCYQAPFTRHNQAVPGRAGITSGRPAPPRPGSEISPSPARHVAAAGHGSLPSPGEGRGGRTGRRHWTGELPIVSNSEYMTFDIATVL